MLHVRGGTVTRKGRGSRRNQAPRGARPPKARASKNDPSPVSDADSELFRRTIGRINPMVLPANTTGADPGQPIAPLPVAESLRPVELAQRPPASGRVQPPPPQPPLSRNLQSLAAEMSMARLARASVSTSSAEPTWQDDDLFARMGEGLNRKERNRLRRGQIRPRADLDLHGMTVNAAVAALERFVTECRARRLRCVRVIHGKGFGSPGGEARIRPAIATWLSSCTSVAAICPAQPADGGTGATYVLLELGTDAPKP